jgi:hypothetical protein
MGKPCVRVVAAVNNVSIKTNPMPSIFSELVTPDIRQPRRDGFEINVRPYPEAWYETPITRLTERPPMPTIKQLSEFMPRTFSRRESDHPLPDPKKPLCRFDPTPFFGRTMQALAANNEIRRVSIDNSMQLNIPGKIEPKPFTQRALRGFRTDAPFASIPVPDTTFCSDEQLSLVSEAFYLCGIKPLYNIDGRFTVSVDDEFFAYRCMHVDDAFAGELLQAFGPNFTRPSLEQALEISKKYGITMRWFDGAFRLDHWPEGKVDESLEAVPVPIDLPPGFRIERNNLGWIVTDAPDADNATFTNQDRINIERTAQDVSQVLAILKELQGRK